MRALMITVGTLIFAAGFVAAAASSPRSGRRDSRSPWTAARFRRAGPHDALFRARAAEGLRDRARVADILARRGDQAVSRRADRVGGEGPVSDTAGNIDHEQSKVLLLVHPDAAAARRSVLAVIEAYRKAFEQRSVLWENARVCVAA